ncbi:hypothetical protein B484DRAFT_439765, partial [Ochromonadaceae sp. CCMP2298]
VMSRRGAAPAATGGADSEVEESVAGRERLTSEKKTLRIRDLDHTANMLHLRTAQLNQNFKDSKKRGGPSRTFILIEVNGCRSPNTGGGATSKVAAKRDKKLLTVAAENKDYAHVYTGDVHNLTSSKLAKTSSVTHSTYVLNEGVADVKKRTADKALKRQRGPTTNHTRSLAQVIMDNQLPRAEA